MGILSIISILFVLLNFLPTFKITHWSFRIFDFFRIQLFVLLLLLFILGFIFHPSCERFFILSQALLLIGMVYQLYIILPYLLVSRSKPKKQSSQTIKILSVNVLQKNDSYNKLIALIEKVQPDIVLTMETNKAWERALEVIEPDYPLSIKVPIENRYGMHFYTRLTVKKSNTHFLISDERPAVEVHLKDKEGSEFVIWGIHPPPPSPTEKLTSKQKDAEMMKAAERIRSLKSPCIAIGDFNNVSWSRASKLFSKVSGLKDARIGRGIYPTFPAKPALFRFPIDLLFKSDAIVIRQIKTLTGIDSDHLPLMCAFYVNGSNRQIKESMDEELKKETKSIIDEGEEAEKIES